MRRTIDRLIIAPFVFLGCIILSVSLGFTADDTKKEQFEINRVLMESTIKIEGDGSSGTGFFIGRPISGSNRSRFTLVTAAHVLDQIQGEFATLHLRQRSDGGKWTRIQTKIKIRDGKRSLYVRHKDADVAAMYVGLPLNMITAGILGTQLLADDDDLKKFEIHPGDNISALGFPLGFEANEAGFPVLRSGKIASYPLLPTAETKTFYFDFRVFKGNSGGPVYVSDTTRFYAGSLHLGPVQFIIGLVTQETIVTEKIKGLYAARDEVYQLGLAEVVHATLIKQTIDLLPTPGDDGKKTSPSSEKNP
jgi:S1-C subfamily serine protease